MYKQFFLLLFLTQVLSAQIPQNFEYLYHDNQHSVLGATHVVEDGVFFVSHNGARDMTVVALAKNDNTQEILFTSEFSSKSEIVITQDSAIHFLLYSLFDYDVGMPGFYDVVYKDDKIEVKSFTYDTTLPIVNEYIRNIYIDSSGNYILGIQNEKLLIFDGSIVVFEKRFNHNILGFLGSDDGALYVVTDFLLYKYDTNAFFPEITSEKIKDFQIIDDYVAVMVERQVNLYDTESSALVNSFNVDTEFLSLNQVGLLDSTLYTMSQQENELTVTSLNWNSEITKESIVQLNENETISAIEYFSDDNILLQGGVRIAELGAYPNLYNSFFRNVDLENGNTYEKTDVEILDYEVIQTGKDSFVNQIFEATNDTIWWVSYLYDINLAIKNNTDGPIYSASIFHSLLFNNFGPTSVKLHEIDSQINANESKSFSFSNESFGTLEALMNLKLFLPGANHRFNLQENIIAFPDFRSNIQEIKIDNALNVYPNPTSDYLNIKSDASVNQVTIYDIQGQLVMAQSDKSRITKIDVSQLEAGTYFIKTSNSVSKFIKQ